jgi:uncharacterized protein YlxW (UPF0749 family)
MSKSTEKLNQFSTFEKNKSEQSKFDSKIFRNGLRVLAASAVAFSITSCGEKPKEVQVDPVQTQETIEIQNKRENTRKGLADLTTKIRSLQSKIKQETNQGNKNKLIIECRELIVKHQNDFDALKYEDKEYIKTRPH